MDHIAELKQALNELQSITPMPSDDELFGNLAALVTDEGDTIAHLLDTYDNLVHQIDKLSVGHRDEIDTPLEEKVVTTLLLSFGLGLGAEVYWSTLTTLEKMDPDILYPAAQQALSSVYPGPRSWSALLLGRRRTTEDVPYLVARLQDSEPEVICEALKALGMIAQHHDLFALIPDVAVLSDHPDAHVRKYSTELIEKLRHSKHI